MSAVQPHSLLPHLGAGVGLRARHFRTVISERPAMDWFEIISENFMDSQGWPAEALSEIARHYRVVPHGVSLSIGSTEPLHAGYLQKLKRLADRVNAPWVSDHLCWTNQGGYNSHDLLPMPYTEASLAHVVDRVKQVQDYLGRRLLLENPSSYLSFRASTMPEWVFLAEAAEQADCGILLDVNNVYVCQRNHGWDALQYLAALPSHRIGQIHLAGHTDHGSHCIDTHIGPVPDPVWTLYQAALARFGAVATLIEWDEQIPEFAALQAEAARASGLLRGESLAPDRFLAADQTASPAVSNPVTFLLGYEANAA